MSPASTTPYCATAENSRSLGVLASTHAPLCCLCSGRLGWLAGWFLGTKPRSCFVCMAAFQVKSDSLIRPFARWWWSQVSACPTLLSPRWASSEPFISAESAFGNRVSIWSRCGHWSGSSSVSLTSAPLTSIGCGYAASHRPRSLDCSCRQSFAVHIRVLVAREMRWGSKHLSIFSCYFWLSLNYFYFASFVWT